jgi:ATP phosphoribosyltransferase regulatory subunit
VLRGGRYDEIGKAFGRARPAVGFSIYLRELAGLSTEPTVRAIYAPALADEALRTAVRGLRAQKEVVVQGLPGSDQAESGGDFVIDRVLVQIEGSWRVVPRSDLTP